MSDHGKALARAAESLARARFRLHGRDPATGLDCVGLVVASLAATGRTVHAPACYGLRNASIAAVLGLAPRAGLLPVADTIIPGDVLLVRTGPLQHHLLVALGGERFVHAHAGLRRVAVTPGPLPWPILRHWRLGPRD